MRLESIGNFNSADQCNDPNGTYGALWEIRDTLRSSAGYLQEKNEDRAQDERHSEC